VKVFGSFVFVVLLICSAQELGAQGKKGAAAAAAPSSSPAAASTPASSSSAFIESQMLAYGALDKIAATVAIKVCTTIPMPAPLVPAVPASAGVPAKSAIPAIPPSTIVIYDQASFASLQAYEGFIANAEAVVSLYETLIPDDNGPSNFDKKTLNANLDAAAKMAHPNKLQAHALGLSSTIDPFSDATSLLSAIAVASNSESAGSIVIPDSAMAVDVTRQLTVGTASCRNKIAKIIYPPLFGNSSSTDYQVADIQADLQRVQDVRDFVTRAVDARIGAATDATLTAALTDANGMYDSFLNSLLQVNSATGAVGSASIIQGYQLATALAGPIDPNGQYSHPAFILLASVLSAGGTERDHKSFWTALGSGDKITFSGGVIVNVALWHSDDATPLYSNLLRFRASFSNIADPAMDTNITRGDNLSDNP
jgi:hypothetical protein